MSVSIQSGISLTPRHNLRGILVGGAIVVATIAAIARVLAFVDVFAINVLYWDQWDFWRALFEDAGPWEIWRQIHGPQRQGLEGSSWR